MRLFAWIFTLSIVSILCSCLPSNVRLRSTQDKSDQHSRTGTGSDPNQTLPDVGGYTNGFNDGADTWRHMNNRTEKTRTVAGIGEPEPNKIIGWAEGKAAKEIVGLAGLTGIQGWLAGKILTAIFGELTKGSPDLSPLGQAPVSKYGENVRGLVFSLDVPQGVSHAESARKGEFGRLELSILVRTYGSHVWRKLTDDEDSVDGWCELSFPWWENKTVEVQVFDADWSAHDAMATFTIDNPYGYYELVVGNQKLGKIGFLSASDVLLLRQQNIKSRIGGALQTYVEVVGVTPNSQAQRAGLKTGDIIESYNGTTIKDFNELSNAKDTASQSRSIRLTFWRDGKNFYANLKPGQIGIRCRTVFG